MISTSVELTLSEVKHEHAQNARQGQWCQRHRALKQLLKHTRHTAVLQQLIAAVMSSFQRN